MPKPRALCLLLTLLSGSTLACGPDFPMTLLDQREGVLFALPESSFEYEVSRLIDVSGLAFKPVENAWPALEPGRRPADTADLDPAQQQRLPRLYALSFAEDVHAEGAGLPAAVVHYIGGAVAFAGGDLRSARSEFEAVLKLEPSERGTRGPMAAYMLARIARAEGEDAGARSALTEVRAQVQAGAPDPLGLAVASLGEEARLALDAGKYAEAVELYARQAALGSASGRSSLLFVARQLAPDAQARSELLQTETGRGLLTAYLLARGHELPPQLPAAGEPVASYDPWSGSGGSERSAAVLAVLNELDAVLPAEAAARDRLAAVAFNAGRYEDSARVLGDVDSARAHWLRAKLALRAGDDAAAAAAYARAIAELGSGEVWSPEGTQMDEYRPSSWPLDTRCRIQAEAGTLALSRGDFLQAMELFFQAAERHWPDAAYLAERVLSVDELQAFVDRVTAEPAAVAQSEDTWLQGLREPKLALRALLGRRLLREGRGAAALAYFDEPVLHGQAAAFVTATELFHDPDVDPLERARAGFAAAELARRAGMELLGFQLDPDYAEYSGMFDLRPAWRWDHEDRRQVRVDRSDISVPEVLSTAEELTRVRASAATPLHRYHYRGTAANLAESAAVLLPPRSQAYAAVMCEATRYVLDADPARAQQLYRRYLREGPYVPWGARFGQECPAPDFDKVERELRAARIAEFKRVAKWSLPPALVLCVLAALLWRRRRRATPP
jgi:hypothetical protein